MNTNWWQEHKWVYWMLVGFLGSGMITGFLDWFNGQPCGYWIGSVMGAGLVYAWLGVRHGDPPRRL